MIMWVIGLIIWVMGIIVVFINWSDYEKTGWVLVGLGLTGQCIGLLVSLWVK